MSSRIKGIIDAVSDLAADYSSRMANANDQGFDTGRVLYHHTEADNIEEFIPSSKGKLGAGVYTSPNPQYGERYVDQSSGSANVLPLFARGPLAKAADIDAASTASRNALLENGQPFSVQEWKSSTNEILKGKGFAGKEVGEEVSIFDPSNIRSVNAAFDPAKKGSSNLLASATGIGLLGALGSEDADASPSKGLFDSMGDTALESMSGVNRAVADGVNFLTSDQINAILNLSGSDKRIPDLYDIPGIEGGTQGNYMEPGLLRQIVRQGSEFLSPI